MCSTFSSPTQVNKTFMYIFFAWNLGHAQSTQISQCITGLNVSACKTAAPFFFLFVLRHCLTLLLWVAWNSPRRWDLTEIHLPLPLEINSVLHFDWPNTILERPYSAFIKLLLCLKTQVRTYCLKGLILYMYENRFFRSCPCHLAGMYLVQEGGWHSAFISSKLKHQYNFYTLLKLSTY